MIQRSGPMRLSSAAAALMFTLAVTSPAWAAELTLKKGTDVKLAFDSSLSSKTARPGDKVMFHVEEPVQVDGNTVIKEGTKVAGTVTKVQKRGHFGVNAHVQLIMSPVKAVDGHSIPLGFKTKGQDVSSKTGEAAGASVGGAALLGPIGLVGGYFITGKSVNAKPGDKMTVDVDKDVMIHVK